MLGKTIYRSYDGEKKVMEMYSRQLSKLNVKYKNRMVNTRYGYTHILCMGPEQAPPVVIFHSNNCTNPFQLQSLLPLAKEFRIYAPDLIGHPGQSAQTRLSCKDLSYGEWASDIIDSLALKKTVCIGNSFGGGIILRLGAFAPEKIDKAVLIVPSGIVKRLFLYNHLRLTISSLLYRASLKNERLEQIGQSLGNSIRKETLEMLGVILQHYKTPQKTFSKMTKNELKSFQAPTLLITAEKDILYPGKPLLKKAKNIIPNIEEDILLSKGYHLVEESEEHMREIIPAVISFINKS